MPLRSWLLDETSDAEAVKAISASPILRAEAEAAIPALRAAALRPAEPSEVERIIQSRFPLFPQSQRSPAEWALWWAEYHDALEGLTPSAIEAGMKAWIKLPDSEFLPKPGRLADLARSSQVPSKWSRAAHRAMKATEPVAAALPPPPQGDRPSPEEIAAMQAEFVKTMKAIGERAAPAPKHTPRPRYTPPVDDYGITPEMRALQERQEL